MKNLLKSKTAMSLLLIGLAAIIIGGATQAWFTDEAEVADATFTAGTVIVNADKAEEFIATPDGKYFDNVNPGDCARVNWNIINEGTKAVELRVKLETLWAGVAEGAEVDPLYFCPPDDSGWVMYSEGEDDLWLYYTGGPVPGTYGDGETEVPVDERTVPLTLVVGFDGPDMGNEYQGASLTIGYNDEDNTNLESFVSAIQASNDAPKTVWGDVWTTVKTGGYVPTSGLAKTYYDYFHGGPGSEMICWDGEENPPLAKNQVVASTNPAGIATITVENPYTEGETVTLTAPSVDGYTFKSWLYRSGLNVLSEEGNVISFEMPAFGVEVRANYEEDIPAPVVDFEIKEVSALKVDHSGGKDGYYQNTKITGKINNLEYDDVKWEGNKTVKIEAQVKTQGGWKETQEFSKTLNFGAGYWDAGDAWFEVKYLGRAVQGNDNVRLRITIDGHSEIYNGFPTS